MAVTTYKWTIEKWHELVNSGVLDGQKVELLEQKIVDMSPEGIEQNRFAQSPSKICDLDGVSETNK
ncbi:MAG: hypothetical protein QNJ33_11270 [Crocosphaera sp.]|nr:hypothetical protein [Crocosphaera sp.]